MNHLEIAVRISHIYEAGGDTRILDFIIDGLSVADRVRRLVPWCMDNSRPDSGPTRGNPDGRMIGVTEWRAVINGELFLTGRHRDFRGPHKGLLPLLVCGDCGMCWCSAVWTRFRRDGHDAILWDGFGFAEDSEWEPIPGAPSFRFSAKQYRSAFTAARAAALAVNPPEERKA